MSKTTPVRWWRDDTTRYLPRRATRPEMSHQLNTTGLGGWAWHMIIRDTEPELGAVVDRFEDIIIGPTWTTPIEWGSTEPIDPIRDIVDGMQRHVEETMRANAYLPYNILNLLGDLP